MDASLNIRTDREVKENAERIFAELGLNVSVAVNIFLRESIRCGGIPFDVKLPQPNATTLAAMREGERIARDPSCKGYSDMKSLREALEDDEA